MSDSATKAVFLSYASQDAEAAQRICAALRAAGVEVWFDQNELVGGDAWDAKIRRQIGSCALFVPVISASTQARLEGYFRIEWKLAAQRTHAMADEKAYLLPVVIDETRDAEARVPAEFKAVQWTRLPGGVATPAFCARVGTLLGDEQTSFAAGAPPEPARGGAKSARRGGLRARWWWAVPMVGALAALAFVLKGPRPVGPARSVAPVSEAATLTAKAYAITNKVGFTREDLALAETYMQRATELEPASARARSVRAWVRACYVMRNWDISERRMQEVQADANAALGMDPDDADALNALGQVFEKQRVPAEQEKVMRRALAAAPDNYRSWLLLARALDAQGHAAEGIATLTEAVRRFPKNVLCRYELANGYAGLGMNPTPVTAQEIAVTLEQLEAAISIQPFSSAILMKAIWEAGGRGDVTRMRTELDRLAALPVADRTEDRAVFVMMWCGLLERKPERVLAAAKLTARGYFEDSIVAGPKGWGTALACRIAGKEALARQEWLATETLLRQRLKDRPNEMDRVMLGTTLAWLGDNLAAGQIVDPIEAAWREDLTPGRARVLACYHAARGDAAKAVPFLALVVNRSSFLTDPLLRLDPWWDRLRGQPEFEAFLAEARNRSLATAQAAASPVPVDDKSVAVLAFANLSDDKANEYFSDGISEELLNVLAKIPGLKVSARTSAFHFKGKDVPVPEIAQKLGVAYVVEGSVRKAGDKVRITAQLIKAADGFHVWSDTFTRDLKDIFAVQDEIAGLIARSLSLKLGAGSAAAPVAPTVNPEAYRLYLEGRAAWNRRDAAGFRQAELLLNQAIELEPRFARAHAALADVWLLQAPELSGSYLQRRSPALMRVVAKAEQAVALDEKSAEAHASLGHALGQVWRFTESLRELRQAVELNPNYASAHQWLGRVLLAQGQLDEALAALRRAAELDPLSHRILDNYSDALECAGRLDEAWAALGRAAALQPSGVQIRCKQALMLQRLGRRGEAMAAARALAADTAAEFPDYRHSTAVAVLSAVGEAAEAEASLRRIAPASEDFPIALVYTGRTREFIAQLDDATINWIHNIWFLPRFAAIRAEPELRAWTRKVGLAEALARAEAWGAAHAATEPEARK